MPTPMPKLVTLATPHANPVDSFLATRACTQPTRFDAKLFVATPVHSEPRSTGFALA